MTVLLECFIPTEEGKVTHLVWHPGAVKVSYENNIVITKSASLLYTYHCKLYGLGSMKIWILIMFCLWTLKTFVSQHVSGLSFWYPAQISFILLQCLISCITVCDWEEIELMRSHKLSCNYLIWHLAREVALCLLLI